MAVDPQSLVNHHTEMKISARINTKPAPAQAQSAAHDSARFGIDGVTRWPFQISRFRQGSLSLFCKPKVQHLHNPIATN
jgi:hypothetical protein